MQCRLGAPTGALPSESDQQESEAATVTTPPPTKGPAGKNKSSRQAAARQQAYAAREAQRAKARRRRLLLSVGIPVLVVVLVVVVLIIVKSTSKSAPPAAGPTGSAGAALEKSIATIPAATFDAVGAGSNVHPPQAVTGAALTADGKPRVLYVGAEYCPYCAGERWAVVAALSRFGTFSQLGTTTSAADDVFPSTATLSFHGATYTSSLLSFTGVELTTNVRSGNSYTPLDTLSAADQQINAAYNAQGSIPFVDFGNKYVIVGASYDVGLLQGLTQTQIAAQLADPSTAAAKGVLGAANMMTAALCKMTNGQPAAVCTSSAVTTAKLP